MLQSELGWRPSHTDFAEGLRATIDWYVANESLVAPGQGGHGGPLPRAGAVGDVVLAFELWLIGQIVCSHWGRRCWSMPPLTI